MLADLHVHSIYSDGTLSPAEIVSRAVRNGVGLLAVCDHNVIEGSLKTAPLARKAGIAFLPGVEIDSMLLGLDTHILCYGADFTDENLLEYIRHARARLDWMSDELCARMCKDYPQLSVDEYNARAHDTALGGWKLLQYLTAKGVTESLRGGFRYYDDYGVTYASAGFRDAREVISAIHAAGGCAILAHPGVTFLNDPVLIEKGLDAALTLGIDGVECCYPKHSPELTERLLAFCREHNLSATAGSDCHGAFGSADPGTGCAETDLLIRNHPALH